MTELRAVIICLKFVYFIFHWGGEQLTKSFILSFICSVLLAALLKNKTNGRHILFSLIFSDLMSVVLLKYAGNYIYFSYLLLN